jgi:hypothetical protein
VNQVNDKKMLILPSELVDIINQNRGDLTQAEFIRFLIDTHLGQESPEVKYATQEELVVLEQDMKRLLRSFIDFSVTYNLELGQDLEADGQKLSLSDKLRELQLTTESPKQARKEKDK